MCCIINIITKRIMTKAHFTQTANGATVLNTSGNVIVDYFMLFMRDLDKKVCREYLEKCWNIDPKKTVAIIFNGRDRVNGKKEKKVSNEAIMWLRENKYNTYIDNIRNYVDKYGCWKDLLYIYYHDDNGKNFELCMFAEQLKIDLDLMKEASEKQGVSLCAKWAPSENDRNDKRKHFAKKIATILYGRDDVKKLEKYRKEYLVPLRERINIVEKLICNNEWDKVKYECVPGVASKRLLKAFMKHDEERYKKYLCDVRNGDKEIKITGILPHELTKYYIEARSFDNREPNETIELQWKAIVDNVRTSGNFNNSLAIVDLSGSMFSAKNGSIPAQVAMSLGIITSLCCKGKFKNKFITFSENPQLVELMPDRSDTDEDPSLFDSFNSIMETNYGFNTDFVKCCECIITYGVDNDIPDCDMPKKLFVFTDMQFDAAASPLSEYTYSDEVKECANIETIYQTIVKMFKANSYTPPKFIFWNLSSDHTETFPVNCNTEGTAIVSGFSEQLLKIFMTYDEFKPEFIVDEVLSPYMEHIVINENDI
jgi:hypothetical protein